MEGRMKEKKGFERNSRCTFEKLSVQSRVTARRSPMEPSPDAGLAPDWRESQATSPPVDFSVARPLLLSKMEEAAGEKCKVTGNGFEDF